MAQKQKSRTTKSPLMQDWVFRLGIVHGLVFLLEFHILNTKLGRRKSSDYKSTMARLLSQTLYIQAQRNAWHYISQFN